MLEGQKDASGLAASRKENRRETWCPGAQGGGEPSHTAISQSDCKLTTRTIFCLCALADKYVFTALIMISLRAGARAFRAGLTPWRRYHAHRNSPKAATVLNVFSHQARATWLVLIKSLCKEALASVLMHCDNDSVLQVQGAAEGRGTLHPT